jgi:opacity protein-like surface antigen
MKRSAFAVAAIALALTASASSAQAQRPVSFGIAAGAAVPTGDLGDATSLGYNVTGSIGYSLPAMPLSFRVDGMFNQLSGKEFSPDVTGPDLRIMGLTANAAYTLPGVAVRPYVIAGAGMYSSKADVDGAESSNDMGVNAGLGVRFALGGLSTYAEARFHNVFVKDDLGEKHNVQFSPISFGIQF